MSVWSKLAAKSLSCSNCHKKLRLHFTATVLVALLVFVSTLSVLVFSGINSKSILFTAICLLAFLLACLFVPLEAVPDDG